MTNALRAFRIRTGMIVCRGQGDISHLLGGWAASRRMLGLHYVCLVTLLSSAASWEIGAPHHNLWIKYAVVGGAILILSKMRQLPQLTVAKIPRVAGTAAGL
jgi:hypothetical protein